MPKARRRRDDEQVMLGGAPIDGIIRKVRRLARFSQRELAERAGVSRGMVGAVESSKVVPSLAVLQRMLYVAGFTIAVVDDQNRRVLPLEVFQDVADLAGRRFPAHLDLIIDPVYGEWWADIYGLERPPETFTRRSQAYRDFQREQSRWEVRAKQLRHDPPPNFPHGQY